MADRCQGRWVSYGAPFAAFFSLTFTDSSMPTRSPTCFVCSVTSALPHLTLGIYIGTVHATHQRLHVSIDALCSHQQHAHAQLMGGACSAPSQHPTRCLHPAVREGSKSPSQTAQDTDFTRT